MNNGNLLTLLTAIVKSGPSGWVWLLSMCFDLVRANLKLILAFRCPSLIFASQGAVLQGLKYAEIGKLSRFARNTRITAWPGGKMHIGRKFSLGENSVIENGFSVVALRGKVEIGDNVGIGAFSFISSPSRVKLGSDCIIGQYFSVHAQNHNFAGESLFRLQGTTEYGVEIGKNCWIGAKVTILDGVSIGDSSVVAAGSVVTSSFPTRSLIGGAPAKLIRNI